jgi:hypothetical protein
MYMSIFFIAELGVKKPHQTKIRRAAAALGGVL